jgi:hypothetical protein
VSLVDLTESGMELKKLLCNSMQISNTKGNYSYLPLNFIRKRPFLVSSFSMHVFHEGIQNLFTLHTVSLHWLRDTPLSAEVGTNFTDKRRPLSRYSSLVDSGHGVFFVCYSVIALWSCVVYMYGRKWWEKRTVTDTHQYILWKRQRTV